MKALFISHGSAVVGFGHIIRCLALAEEFREQGWVVRFYSSYQAGREILKAHGFLVIGEVQETPQACGFSYGSQASLDKEIRMLGQLLPEIKPDVIVADTYNISENYFGQLRPYTNCLVYIDDRNSFDYPVDIVINGTASAFAMGYPKEPVRRYLLGPSYAMLRKEFRDVPKKTPGVNIRKLLVSTGGCDPYHMTERVIGWLSELPIFPSWEINVIIGKGFSKEARQAKCFREHMNVRLLHDPPNMAEVMSKSDLAITSGGSMLYELAACGVPSIIFAYAQNQEPQIKAMESDGLIEYLGPYHALSKPGLYEAIQRLQNNIGLRNDRIMRLQNYVDGMGTQRIVQIIVNVVTNNKMKRRKHDTLL